MNTVAELEQDYGGSPDAIKYHYDVGREFYQLWLDDSMTYSSALWAEEGQSAKDTLAAAQRRKIDLHLQQARVSRASRVMDVGCGWGGVVAAACAMPNVQQVVGLTLSDDQAEYVRAMGLSKAEIRLESWVDHEPQAPYDSIISVGAFEHFAKPEDSIEEKIEVYRHFFEKCRQWLAPHGRMSLQSIAYGNMRREDSSAFINNEIFPASDLPTLDEIARAADGVMEITTVYNHRLHYARTMEAWARNLRSRRDEAVALVGEETTARYETYLTQTAVGFYMGKIGLLRLALRPITPSWKESAAY
ncbi:class I SAM-dependent methyltransferase [Bordetella genomosp. 13]|uniref:Cyclopropane-fatty-acyl-phospholipid synthase n=1 Tax=Bordetella genomosp. 13 TaxID=463040 RepID=A0A1W6ZBT7_9BORD|nr:class I SAM-dependent methyltransferase [Bordetella genomosp. 13]ARP94725.1 cyclopropane-fatty-acyl-phospholipid synthase [Bordetella genomosp. 13]